MQPREVLLQAARFSQVETLFKMQSTAGKAVNISVLASLSSQHFLSVFKLFLYAEGLVPEIHASEFDGIISDGLDQKSRVWEKQPDVLIVLPALDDIKVWPRMFADTGDIEAWVKAQAEPYKNIWHSVMQRYPMARVYQGLFVPPIERQLGNLERTYPFSKTNCLAMLNGYLLRDCPPFVTMVDLETISSLVGRKQWFDETAYFLSKQPFAIREIPLVAAYFARLVASGQGLIRKCLVLDLDNTLWGGVIGDDGFAGIRLSPSDPVGEAYLSFQKYLLALKERGVLLAICSKNDEVIARSIFEQHEDILLSLDDFSAFKANWDDKPTNLRRIAEELNIGVDSIVFFDDNPAERSIVEQFEPDVLVIDVPEDPAQYIRALDLSFAFEWPQLTVEDTTRADSYLHNHMRHQLEGLHHNYDEYLRSLQMSAWIELTEDASVSRVSQLINKTNQFNLRTKRYSEENLNLMKSSSEFLLMHVRLKDRFTNYGIIASAIIKFSGNIAFIDNWVMSCRVFKRGLEHAFFNAIIGAVRTRSSIEFLAAEYIPTSKSSYVSDLLDNLGLVRCEVSPQDWPFEKSTGILYQTPISQLTCKPHFIELALDLDRLTPVRPTQSEAGIDVENNHC